MGDALDRLAEVQSLLPGLRSGHDVVVNLSVREAESFIAAAKAALTKAQHLAAAHAALTALEEEAAA